MVGIPGTGWDGVPGTGIESQELGLNLRLGLNSSGARIDS